MRQIKNLLAACIIMAFVFSSCKKEETSSAPALPPLSSMKMDTSFTSFAGLKSASVVDEYSNVKQAVVVVNAARAAAVLFTIIPVVAFDKAIKETPIYNDVDKVWVWSFKFSLGIEYTAELTGKVSDTKVDWTMKIYSDPSNKVKWFDGTSNYDNKSGTWTIYDQSVAALKIDWTKTGDNLGTLKYTNVKPNDAKNGEYIEFGSTTSTLDKYFKISIKKDDLTPTNNGKTFEIDWSSTAKNGTISKILPLPVEKIGCWGTDLKNLATCN